MIQSSKRNRWFQLRQDSLPTATGELGEVICVLIPSQAKALPLWVGKEAGWAQAVVLPKMSAVCLLLNLGQKTGI